VPLDRLLDPVTIELQPVLNRDAARTPMPWDPSDGAGFTELGVEPWLPFGDLAWNVADQRDDPTSTLHFVRDVLALRRELDDLRGGAYATHTASGGLWAWRRGDGVVVAINLGDEAATVDNVSGAIAIGTDRSRDGEKVDGSVRVAPNEGLIITSK
jgi:alpha-glucosidase